MSYKHKLQPLPCLMATLFTLLCSVAMPLQSDISKNRRTQETYSKLRELGERKPVYLYALWPSDDELTSYRVDLSMLQPTIVEHTTSWIRRAIEGKWLPKEMQLIAMKDWKRRERRVHARGTAYGVIVDSLITEFSLHGHNFQIQDSGKFLGVLIFPVKPNRIASPIEDYITNSISKFLNVPPSQLGSIEYTLEYSGLEANEKIYYGVAWCDWDWQKNTSWDTVKYQTWWNKMSVCTDGNFIFLGIPELLPNPNRNRTAIGFTTEHNPRF